MKRSAGSSEDFRSCLCFYSSHCGDGRRRHLAGRLAKRPNSPDYDSLSDWQKIEHTDSMLRYADAQLARGDAEGASGLYRQALDREEQHLQCAAIIGPATVGTADAAAAIFPKLSSDDNTVRITAQNAWAGMSKGAAG